MVSAMRAASRVTGCVALASSSGAHARRGLGGRGLFGRPDLEHAGVTEAVGDVGNRLFGPLTPGVRVGAAKIWSTAPSSGSTVRKESVRGICRQLRPARVRRRRTPSRLPRTWSARRLESRRSTASRRRRQTACAPLPARHRQRRIPAASERITCHCTGLVSWASSTRMWSSPPSSLNSTHSTAAEERKQACSLGDEIIEIEHRQARFGRPIAGQRIAAQLRQRQGRLDHGQRHLFAVKRHKASLCRRQLGGKIGPASSRVTSRARGILPCVRKQAFKAATRPPVEPQRARARDLRARS